MAVPQDFGGSRLQLMVETLESSPFPWSKLISHPSVFREGYTDGFDQEGLYPWLLLSDPLGIFFLMNLSLCLVQ